MKTCWEGIKLLTANFVFIQFGDGETGVQHESENEKCEPEKRAFEITFQNHMEKNKYATVDFFSPGMMQK